MAKTYRKDGNKTNTRQAILEHQERKANKYGRVDYSEVFYESVDDTIRRSPMVSRGDDFKAVVRESLDVKLHNKLEEMKQKLATGIKANDKE